MFQLLVSDEYIPAKPPSGWDHKVRVNPTTQVSASFSGWTGNIFRFWLPENVGVLWNNWTPEEAHQDFSSTENKGLKWSFQRGATARVEVQIEPQHRTLNIESEVENHSPSNLSDVTVNVCLQLSQAPDFACDDFSRIYIRTDADWKPIKILNPVTDYPQYLAPDLYPTHKNIRRGLTLPELYENVVADHPLIVYLSKKGDRAVGTASSDFQYLFHNRANENLLCMHSQQRPVGTLEPGGVASFNQKVYFVEGGVAECVSAFENDPV